MLGKFFLLAFFVNDNVLGSTAQEVVVEDEDNTLDLTKPIVNIDMVENAAAAKKEEIEEEKNDVENDDAISSAQDLLDKLNTLQSLLGQMNHISPEMADQVSNLRHELKNLGLGDGFGDSFGSAEKSDEQALEVFVKKCWIMAVKHLGGRISTKSKILDISNANFTAGFPEEMVDNTVFEAAAYCCQEITEEEVREFDSKITTSMPKRLSLKLGTEESKNVVKTVSTEVMKLIYEVATESSFDIRESMEQERGNRYNSLSTTVMALCTACFVFVISFLMKRFLDMQRDLKTGKSTGKIKKKQ